MSSKNNKTTPQNPLPVTTKKSTSPEETPGVLQDVSLEETPEETPGEPMISTPITEALKEEEELQKKRQRNRTKPKSSDSKEESEENEGIDFQQTSFEIYQEEVKAKNSKPRFLYWVGLTPDSPFQTLSVRNVTLEMDVEEVGERNDYDEESRVTRRGKIVRLTEDQARESIDDLARRYFSYSRPFMIRYQPLKNGKPHEIFTKMYRVGNDHEWDFHQKGTHTPTQIYAWFLKVSDTKKLIKKQAEEEDFYDTGITSFRESFTPPLLMARPKWMPSPWQNIYCNASTLMRIKPDETQEDPNDEELISRKMFDKINSD